MDTGAETQRATSAGLAALLLVESTSRLADEIPRRNIFVGLHLPVRHTQRRRRPPNRLVRPKPARNCANKSDKTSTGVASLSTAKDVGPATHDLELHSRMSPAKRSPAIARASRATQPAHAPLLAHPGKDSRAPQRHDSHHRGSPPTRHHRAKLQKQKLQVQREPANIVDREATLSTRSLVEDLDGHPLLKLRNPEPKVAAPFQQVDTNRLENFALRAKVRQSNKTRDLTTSGAQNHQGRHRRTRIQTPSSSWMKTSTRLQRRCSQRKVRAADKKSTPTTLSTTPSRNNSVREQQKSRPAHEQTKKRLTQTNHEAPDSQPQSSQAQAVRLTATHSRKLSATSLVRPLFPGLRSIT